MAEEESQHQLNGMTRRYRRLRLSLFEQVLLGAMFLILTVTSLDALDGKNIGKNDALNLAKLQGQQELMASVFKFK
jgi:hypothetical protein